LLRVLETNQYRRIGGSEVLETRARIVTATNRKPGDAVQFGRLREDLYYRISQLEIHMPPLRERGDDVVQLARHFSNEYAAETGQLTTLSPAAERALREHHWPGNVRELWNAIQIACTAARGEVLPGHLPDFEGEAPAAVAASYPSKASGLLQLPVGISLADAERRLILATLEKESGNKRRTAETLGISLRTLYNRLKQYDT
ncbi:MAG: helix-turn-helix domain-containing protein, partial [Halieaceae bacterium]|nr:helix-turn-helix domain-containing protein [Halieaceae bacterium]